MSTLLQIVLSIVVTTVAVTAVIYLMVPVFKGIGWVISSVIRFVGSEIGDSFRVVGSLITSVVFIPLVLVNILIGRWSASAHYGSAIKREFAGIGHCVYRLAIGNPARLFGMQSLVEGIEKRVPDAVAHAPTADMPSKRTGQFEGYTIVGSLRGGGSGAKIYIAQPDATRLAIFARAGRTNIDQVVIKSFSLKDGSSLPQIVRESRALEAAKKIGLVLEHELNDQRFYYVMPYVPGDDLGVATRKLHDASGADGLAGRQLADGVGYVADLVRTLDRYHSGGLWHKDVKPDNIIVSAGRAHVVDLGLVTPLSSGMTLTTHGTEYFRDPEMVRLALKGVKVHEVDGAKFDIYAAGAVLYSVIENSFPAHGGLSQVTKRCPEAIRWIIRRAMTDYSSRYNSAHEMKLDLETVLAAPDPFAVKPIDLPSMSGVDPESVVEPPRPVQVAFAASPRPRPVASPADAAPAFAPAPVRGPMDPATQPAPGAGRKRPNLRISDWRRGHYVPVDAPAGQAAQGFSPGGNRQDPRIHVGPRASAEDQLANARRRVSAAQTRVCARMNRSGRYSNRPNAGVGIALFVFIGACVLGGVSLFNGSSEVHTKRAGNNVTIHTGDHSRVRSREDVAAAVENAGRRFAETIVSITSAVKNAVESDQAHAPRDSALVTQDPDADDEESATPAQQAPAKADRSLARSGSNSWLVNDRASEGASAVGRKAIAGKLDRLRAASIELSGLGDDADDVERLAALRLTIGQGSPNDRVTSDRVVAWLREQGSDLRGIVWIEPGATKDAPAFHLFAEDALEARRVQRVLDKKSR